MVYQIIQKGSPNHFEGRDGEVVVAVIDHIIDGSIESAHSWFQQTTDEANRVSAHFGVALDGRIWQWVALENAAWANGILQSPDTSIPWLAECAAKEINPNNRTVSIEHEGHPFQDAAKTIPSVMPGAQYQATLWLHRLLIAKFHLPVDRNHITGHYKIMSKDRANCPGPGYPWSRLMKDLLQGTPTPPAPPVVPYDPNPKHFSIGPGMLAKLKANGLVAATDEQWMEGPAGKRSMLYTTVPGLLLIAFIQPDGSAEVKRFRQLD